MQALRQAAVTFCMACIGAELLTLLAGDSRLARCIKTAAGLYILAVLISLLPGSPAGVRSVLSAVKTEVPAVADMENTEAQLLSCAQTQLEQECEARCRRKFGAEVQVSVTLEAVGQEAVVTKAAVQFPPACETVQKQQIRSYLQQELGVLPAAVGETEP